jgi:hypothetical protein
MFKYADIKKIDQMMPLIEKEKVSIIARGKDQFLSNYRKYGQNNLPDNWKIKRENFIKRHLVSYKKNPTLRRKLALLVWAYEV